MVFSASPCDEALSVLRALLGPVRAEPGCSATRLLRDVDADGALTWVEEWRSAADFERHFRAPTFRSILAVMDLAVARPEVEIDEVASRRGFDFVEENLGLSGLQARGDP
jgi:quinol monooxygenase YgiN